MTKKRIKIQNRNHDKVMPNHFWVGSFCRCIFNGREYFPRGTVAASDIITLVNDLGNRISDKSWMLYLLEIFNTQNFTCELNLICQFDGQNYFEAISIQTSVANTQSFIPTSDYYESIRLYNQLSSN